MDTNNAATFLVIGDLHIKPSNIPETAKLRRILVNIANEKNPDMIVMLGDTLHNFNTVQTPALSEAVKIIKELREIAPILFLIGNHDLPGPNSFLTDVHPFGLLSICDRVILADQQCEIFTLNGMKFAAVPYVPDGKFREALESNPDYKDEDIRCIFAHQTFIGCDMDGIISQSGDSIHKRWKLIISGHIHGHQVLKKKVHYAGTPRQTSFGDSVDKTVSFFTITPTTHEEERIPIGLPPKLTFRVACSKIHKLKLPKKGDIRVNIVGTSTEIATVKSHPIVKKWESRGVKIKYTFMREDIDITQIKENIKNFSSESQSSGSVTFRNLFAKEIERNPEYKKIYRKVKS